MQIRLEGHLTDAKKPLSHSTSKKNKYIMHLLSIGNDVLIEEMCAFVATSEHAFQIEKTYINHAYKSKMKILNDIHASQFHYDEKYNRRKVNYKLPPVNEFTVEWEKKNSLKK